jgi:hypothetical protein
MVVWLRVRRGRRFRSVGEWLKKKTSLIAAHQRFDRQPMGRTSDCLVNIHGFAMTMRLQRGGRRHLS